MRRSIPLFVLLLTLTACGVRPGKPAYERRGDEILVAGQLFHTGAPVVLWTDPGGYDAYRVERRFAPLPKSAWEHAPEAIQTPNRYGLRGAGHLPPETLEAVRGGGWTLEQLREIVDLFVIHYDVSGTSRRCFKVLHDHRGLSVHFLLDVDGTIYQTLDLKERAWHAGAANDRSIGIEIAHIGAYRPDNTKRLDEWYSRDGSGARLTLPAGEEVYLRNPHASLRPERPEPVEGRINGSRLVQYDFTPEQYDSLVKLTRALRRVFPKIRDDFPRDEHGGVRMDRPLTEEELANYAGVLGHHHVIKSKIDPGPAFQWDRIRQTRP